MKNFIHNILYSISKRIFRWIEIFINYKYTKAINPSLTLAQIRAYNKQRTLGPSKIICNAPFNSIYVRQNGEISVCCASRYESIGNLKKNSIEEIWHGNDANNLRKRIKNYRLDGACTSCGHALKNKNYNSYIGRYYDWILSPVNYVFPLEITLETSNICNLECIMCSGKFSHLIRKNREQITAIPIDVSTAHYDNLKIYLQKIKRLKLLGGEPFLIDDYNNIIEYVIEHNKKCKIYVQTNGTVLTQRVKKNLAHKNIEISISIDSLQKETYEKIRINAKFENTLNNIKYFQERAIRLKQTININFCLMNMNWQEIPDIIEFCEARNFSLNIIFVEYPRLHSIRILKTDKLITILNTIELARLKTNKEDYLIILNNLSSKINRFISEDINKKTNNFNDINVTQRIEYTIQNLGNRFTETECIEIKEHLFNILEKVTDEKKIRLLNLLQDEINFANNNISNELNIIEDKLIQMKFLIDNLHIELN
ncbi:MAG: radical SAM protein [Bacteroidia bacterium]|nr:radical SAM protein [Bacteroidia bacterium]